MWRAHAQCFLTAALPLPMFVPQGTQNSWFCCTSKRSSANSTARWRSVVGVTSVLLAPFLRLLDPRPALFAPMNKPYGKFVLVSGQQQQH